MTQEWEKVTYEPLLLKPKVEPLDEFKIASDDLEKEVSNQSSEFPKEPKDEPLDLSFSFDNELNMSNIGDKDYKKEEMPDYDYMLSQDRASNNSEESEFSFLFPVEPKLEALEDRVVIAVENPKGLKLFDDFNDEATVADSECDGHQFKLNKSGNVRFQKRVKCILCEKYLSNVYAYYNHLSNKHKSTPRANGISVLCSCNVEVNNGSRDTAHGRECDGQDFTIQKRELNKSFDIPQCIFCENGIFLRCACGREVHNNDQDPVQSMKCNKHVFTVHKLDLNLKSIETPLILKYPSTIQEYCSHLFRPHKSNLRKNGIFLRCSCGSEVHSNYYDTTHSNKCAGIEFTLHKLEDKQIKTAFHTSHSTPQCVLCEKHPPTVYEYIHHLYQQHNSTLKANHIYLRCSCSVEARSNTLNLTHMKECAGIEYYRLRVDKAMWASPQCIICEKFPQTAYSYTQHLEYEHKTSLNANRIYLLCSCGYEFRSFRRSMSHKCRARKFTIQNDRPLNYDHCYSFLRYTLY